MWAMAVLTVKWFIGLEIWATILVRPLSYNGLREGAEVLVMGTLYFLHSFGFCTVSILI
jgi:hypothetical protein